MSDVDVLVADLCKGDPEERVPLEIVTAMAAAALKAGWQPPYICQHDWGSQIDGWYACVLCGSEVRKPRVHQWSNPLSAEDFALITQMGIATWLAKPRDPTDD